MNRKIGRVFKYYRSVYITDNLAEFAESVGLPYATLSKFERGYNLMAKYVFIYLAKLEQEQQLELLREIQRITGKNNGS